MKGLFEMIKTILFMKNNNSSNLAKKSYGDEPSVRNNNSHSMLGYRSYGNVKMSKRRKRNGYKKFFTKYIKKNK